jgi:undecaprenyl-diphosphatase
VQQTRRAPTVITLICASILLGVLTWRVHGAGSAIDADAYWADLIHAARSEHFSTLMLALHAWQGKLVTTCVVLWTAALARRKQWSWLLLLTVAAPGGMLANAVLKMLVERPRPAVAAAVGSHGFSYPSGHVVAITLFCGCLLFGIFSRTSKTSGRIVACVGVSAIVALVATSRVYLDVHQPSDVVAAILFSIGWLSVSLLLAPALGVPHDDRRSTAAQAEPLLQAPAGSQAAPRSITIR